jgi:hypothetical protein
MIAMTSIGNKHQYASKALHEAIVRAQEDVGWGYFTTTMLAGSVGPDDHVATS